MSRYPIPKQRVRIEHRVKNSRFIATADRTFSADEAKAFIHSIRNEMPGANHHVYAYKIGYGNSIIEGMSDDGEPSGTAGPPVMSVVKNAPVGDITLVVTRFFGGTKLGTGGLVSAYSESAKLVMAELETEEKIERTALSFSIPYSNLPAVEKALLTFEATNLIKRFEADITLSCKIPSEHLTLLRGRLNDILQTKVIWETGGKLE